MEALLALLLVRGELLLLEGLEADAGLADANDDHAAALRPPRLVLFVGERDADLRDAAGRRGGRGLVEGVLLIVHVDAGTAAGRGRDGQTAVVGSGLLGVEGELLAGDCLPPADPAHREDGGGQAEENEDEDQERNEEVNDGRRHLGGVLAAAKDAPSCHEVG